MCTSGRLSREQIVTLRIALLMMAGAIIGTRYSLHDFLCGMMFGISIALNLAVACGKEICFLKYFGD